MKIVKLFQRILIVLFLMIFIGKYNRIYAQPIVGDWTIPTDFGQLVITVSCQGTCISNIVESFSNFSCGGVTVSGSVSVSRALGWSITNNQFTIENNLDGVGNQKIKIEGTFNEAGNEVSGAWTTDMYGTICSGQWGPTTVNAVAVSGRLIFPEAISDKKYWVIIDDDAFNTDNSYFLKTEGICASGTTTDFLFDKITEGTYFLYAGVRVDSISGPPPETIDYLGIYGGTFDNLPAEANVEISLLNQPLYDINMSQYTFVKLFTEHTIDTEFDHASFVSTADIDGDGDIDILGSADYSNQIVWWENRNKIEFTKHTIDSNFEGAKCVHGGDLDNDGDIDIVGAARYGIAWWENDGSQSFSKNTLVTELTFATSLSLTDIDGDNDLDIIGALSWENEIACWENDGIGNFSKNTIDDNFDDANSIFMVDIDRDGDIDIVGAAQYGNEISWWENDGSTNFSKHIVDDDYDGACAVFAADINGDDQVDLLAAARDGDEISWWENDGSKNFTKHVIDDNIRWPESVSAADLDLDGDLDIMSAAYLDGSIIWYENRGDYIFKKNILNSQLVGACAVWPSDIDNDGDSDIIGASSLKNVVIWWENMNFVVGLEDEHFTDRNIKYSLFQNFPNPFNPYTTINYAIPEKSMVIIKVFDVLGKEVTTLVKKEQSQGNYEIEFDAKQLTSGIYFYRLQAGDFVETKKMILLK